MQGRRRWLLASFVALPVGMVACGSGAGANNSGKDAGPGDNAGAAGAVASAGAGGSAAGGSASGGAGGSAAGGSASGGAGGSAAGASGGVGASGGAGGSAQGGSTVWVYHNGKLNWAGDWSFGGLTVNYQDTSGVPLDGPYDISLTENGQWAGWQPYVSGNCNTNVADCFDTTPYQYVIFSVKPTIANQSFGFDFMSANDTPDGPQLQDIGPYCTGGETPPAGHWESCKIPLSVFQLTDPVILKFAIQDKTGLTTNEWYMDDVGFSN